MLTVEGKKEIIIKPNDEKYHGHRAPEKIPIVAYYDSFLNGIAITFTRDLGNIEVNVTNHTTGEYLEGTMNAAAGVTMLPISGDEGYYTLTFTLSGGKVYEGKFEL
ncbi:MAG: DUF3244 domain-containing protein [Bacteroidales bacterium]|nr:DUF3244 domain-containing protein [Bacteroidales bacterium]